MRCLRVDMETAVSRLSNMCTIDRVVEKHRGTLALRARRNSRSCTQIGLETSRDTRRERNTDRSCVAGRGRLGCLVDRVAPRQGCRGADRPRRGPFWEISESASLSRYCRTKPYAHMLSCSGLGIGRSRRKRRPDDFRRETERERERAEPRERERASQNVFFRR